MAENEGNDKGKDEKKKKESNNDIPEDFGITLGGSSLKQDKNTSTFTCSVCNGSFSSPEQYRAHIPYCRQEFRPR